MSKGKLWGIILLILFVLGFGIWLYTVPCKFTHLIFM